MNFDISFLFVVIQASGNSTVIQQQNVGQIQQIEVQHQTILQQNIQQQNIYTTASATKETTKEDDDSTAVRGML